MMVSIISPFASIVLMFSFSKNTGISLSFNCLMYFKQSSVFLANRLMDFVMIMSIFPFMLSSIILLNCSRFFVFVPDRSEEHTSELQSRGHLVCRLLLEKKK